MNKKSILPVLIIAAIAVGVIILNDKPESDIVEPSSQNRMERIVPEKDLKSRTNEKNSSKYIEYSKATLDQSAEKRRVLYFYASWCPTCRIADPDLSANTDKFPEDVVVLRVNYNDPETTQEEIDLARKYSVTYQHTFVQIDTEGKEVKKWNGGKTEELLVNLQ